MASALSRYGPILRNTTTTTLTEAAVIVTRVEIEVDMRTDCATLGIHTNYSYSLTLTAGAATVRLRAASRFAVRNKNPQYPKSPGKLRCFINSSRLMADVGSFQVAHGLETLAQLYYSSRGAPAAFNGFTVADAPRYPYRALMIDCGRRFVVASAVVLSFCCTLLSLSFLDPSASLLSPLSLACWRCRTAPRAPLH